MALVIPQLVFALVAAWGLVELFRKETDRKRALKALYYAVGITGGLCLFFALFTPMDFRSALDAQYGMPDWYMNALAGRLPVCVYPFGQAFALCALHPVGVGIGGFVGSGQALPEPVAFREEEFHPAGACPVGGGPHHHAGQG